jgi:hypothetical protein
MVALQRWHSAAVLQRAAAGISRSDVAQILCAVSQLAVCPLGVCLVCTISMQELHTYCWHMYTVPRILQAFSIQPVMAAIDSKSCASAL